MGFRAQPPQGSKPSGGFCYGPMTVRAPDEIALPLHSHRGNVAQTWPLNAPDR